MRCTALAIFFGLIALVFATAIESDPVVQDLTKRMEDEEVVASTLPDGRRRLDVYEEGVYQGYIIESENGADAFDPYGNEIDLDQLDDDSDSDSDDAATLAKRSRLRIILKFGKIIRKWGKRAWNYFYCVGFNVMLKCGNKFLTCAERGQAPWHCISGALCIGKKAKNCRG